MRTHVAQRIVNAVFTELEGRKGFDWQFDAVRDDSETYTELYEACVQRVKDGWEEAKSATVAGTESAVEESHFFPKKFTGG